jgi:MFS family permease
LNVTVNAGHSEGLTAVRWRVVAAVVLLAFITIVDRVCISSAKLNISADLRITDVQFGWVFGVFALGYAILMVPAGWLADRIGPHLFLAAIVCTWSLLTAGTGFVTGLASLLIVRSPVWSRRSGGVSDG